MLTGSTRAAARHNNLTGNVEATVGFEPTMRVLQTLALPLGDVALATAAESLSAAVF
jgi:hypothetical protein